MQKWVNFYKDRLNSRYASHIRSKYSAFIDVIDDEINADSVLIEIGCGIGSISYELARRNRYNKLILTDINEQMLQMTKLNAVNYGVQKNCTLLQCNATQKIPVNNSIIRNKKTIVHSHGLLEHFSDEQIRSCISAQKRLSNVLLHYVPSHKYKEPSFGDERLMAPDEWKSICEPTSIIEFNDGYDLILIWRQQ